MLQRSRNTANNNTNSNRSSNNSSNNGSTAPTTAAAAAAATAAAARSGLTTSAGRRKRFAVRPRSKRHQGICLAALFVVCLFCVINVLFSASTIAAFTGGGSSSLEPEVTVLSLDFQGASRTAEKKPRIAIVSNAVAFPFNEVTTAQWSLFKEYFANKDCYAQTHGYDLIIDSR
ncbi:unnamed protein product [Laminaria digitata]